MEKLAVDELVKALRYCTSENHKCHLCPVKKECDKAVYESDLSASQWLNLQAADALEKLQDEEEDK